MRTISPLAAVLVATLPAQEAFFPEGADRVVVPLRHLDRGRPGWLVGIDVEIAGEKTTLVLDPGAGANVIDPDLSDRLELKAVMEMQVLHPDSREMSKLVALPTIAFGGMTQEGHTGLRLQLRSRLGEHSVPIGGILGTLFFSLYFVTFDLDNDTVIIHDPDAFEAPVDAHEVKFELIGLTPTIRVKLGEQKPMRMMVDIGASLGLVLYPRHVERLRLLEGSHGYYESTSGKLFTALLEHAAIGTLALEDVSIGLDAPGRGEGFTADRMRAGIVGSGVVWRFRPTFDYRRKRLYLGKRSGAPGPWSMDYGFSLGTSGDDEIDVSRVLAGSPAALAGIEQGDVVVSLDGWPVGGDINGVNRRLRATTRTSLTIRRDGASQTVELERKPVLRPLRWPE